MLNVEPDGPGSENDEEDGENPADDAGAEVGATARGVPSSGSIVAATTVTASGGGSKRRHASEETGFNLSRHITMIKVMINLLLALLYFTVSYVLEFGNLETSLMQGPSQVFTDLHVGRIYGSCRGGKNEFPERD